MDMEKNNFTNKEGEAPVKTSKGIGVIVIIGIIFLIVALIAAYLYISSQPGALNPDINVGT